MALNPPAGALRPLFNRSKQPAKVSIVIAPGDELHVSADLAAQLTAASSALADIAAADAPKGAPAPADDGAAASEPDASPQPKARKKV